MERRRAVKGAERPGFPKHRVSRVLVREGCSSIKHRVAAEGPFIQLTTDGLPERQVFLGITSSEFILVKQVILDSPKSPQTEADPEVADLVLDFVIPLPLLKFFILDDRAKRFTVCTCFGYMLHFEMCQLDLKSDELWMTWRHVLLEISGKTGVRYGFLSWRSSYVLDIKKYSDFEKKVIKFGDAFQGTLSYIHHPIPFHQVRSIGVQTTLTSDPKISYSKNDVTIPKVSRHSDGNVLDTSKTEHDLGAKPETRLLFLSVTFPTDWNSQKRVVPDKSSSWTNMSSNEDASYLLTKDENRNENLKMMKKKQHRRPSSLKDFLDAESDSDSDEDLDDVVLEYDTRQSKGGDATVNWQKAKHLVLKKEKTKDAINFIRQAVFRTIGKSKVGLPEDIALIDPKDVSDCLTTMSRRLLMTLRPSDMTEYMTSKGRRIPKCIAMASEFSHSVSKMVAVEILQCQSLSKRISTMKLFIEVCKDLLFQQRDFQSLVAVLEGLTSLPIYRLNTIWATLFMENPLTFRNFIGIVKLLPPNAHSIAYTQRVRTCIESNKPFIPWLDHFFHHYRSNAIHLHVNTCGERIKQTRETVTAEKHPTSDKTVKSVSILNTIFCMKSTQDPLMHASDTTVPCKGTPITKSKYVSQPNVLKIYKDDSTSLCLKSILKKVGEISKSRSFPSDQKYQNRVHFTVEDKAEEDDKHVGNGRFNDFADKALATGLKRNDTKSVSKYDVEEPGTVRFAEQTSTGERKDEEAAYSNVQRIIKTLGMSHKGSTGSLNHTQSDKFPTNIERGVPKDLVRRRCYDISSDDSDSEDSGRVSSSEELSREMKDEINPLRTFYQVNRSKRTSLTNPVLDSFELSPQRRLSYVPPVVFGGRRQSLFEENLTTVEDTVDDDEVFEEMMRKKLGTMKKRGSIALELITPDERDVDKWDNAHARDEVNESNNSKREKGTNEKKKIHFGLVRNAFGLISVGKKDFVKRHAFRVTKTSSLENICSRSDNCSLCGLKRCIYVHDGQLLWFQRIARQIRPKSRKRVSEFILNKVKVCNKLSDYNVLQMSLETE